MNRPLLPRLALVPVLAILVACETGNTPKDAAAPPGQEYTVSLSVQDFSDLPKCSASLSGTTAAVDSPAGLWSCKGGKWQALPCSTGLAGSVAYASSTKTLWACVSGQWTFVVLPSGSPGPVGPAGPAGPKGDAGAPGTTVLVAQSAEPAGEHCANGGTKIEAGPDANADGTLDGSEVSSTSYVCNGAPGATGAPGSPGTLLEVTAEPAGQNCASGGERIDAGVDENGDRILEPTEITKTTYVCNGTGAATPDDGGVGSGQCKPAEFACDGLQPQICDTSGTFHAFGAPCQNQACVAGSCVGVCTPGAVQCSGDGSAVETCGATGTWEDQPCAPGYCAGGACTCGYGLALCDGACIDVLHDPSNCGGCGATCGSTQACYWGYCYDCTYLGQQSCGSYCADLANDTSNCGTCGTTCPSSFACVNGVCGCAPGSTLCNGVCEALDSDAQNCGACGVACRADQVCSGGTCACPAGTALCGGTCIDVLEDPRNCGACGNVCAGGACVGGACACALFSENFSDDSAGWTSNGVWTISGGVAWLNAFDTDWGRWVWLASPSFDASGTGPLTLHFRSKALQSLSVSVFQNGTWNSVWNTYGNEPLQAGLTEHVVDISAYANPALQVRFETTLNSSNYAVIDLDDVLVYRDGSCQ
jgi:hypothetical protein